MPSLPGYVDAWLRAFSTAVRRRDFAAAEPLFDQDVVSFGTVCVHAGTLDELMAHQWHIVWPNTEGFAFDVSSVRIDEAPGQTVVISTWSSTGFDAEGGPVPRRGRATIVLRNVGEEWKAVHTHFSLRPSSRNDPVLRHR